MAEKKRLNHFLNDMLKLSCVKMPIIQSATNSPAASFGHHQKREAFPMSQKQQRRLSGYGFINVGLPPASPSENEDVDESQTMFLIAGYSRYNRPYVWVRTNHERLVRLASEEEKDYPLMLQTTSQWTEKEVKVWDVLTELVEVCAAPCPPNPFAVDLDYFQSLPLQERALASAAMISFLQRVIASGHHSYNRRIVSDIGKVGQIHFATMQRMIQDDIIKLPSSTPAVTRHTVGQKNPATVPRSAMTTDGVSPVPMSGTKVVSTAPFSVPPPQSSYPVPRGISAGQTRPMFTPTQYTPGTGSTPAQYGGRVSSTPAQYVGGVTSTPTPLQPQRSIPQQSHEHQTSTAQSGGQFYSRRMGGSYNY
ncbi:hypothetical protein GBAR_LOCUS28040 [Geodia barretti]|uniref:DUF7886 domain-containing protein n=1 Tax=Geodia barretti TaxID=519541 RepID=A0AA35TP60_GEOBA|nr:hypothetical protein GBAR_LOCUS28040 [Geodia barretti]